ncbi:MAG TPA: ATP-binding protein [Chitinispirillaceae bacterium]|nr:ATP-binding protein [Chitinispirillaceae bacterium]
MIRVWFGIDNNPFSLENVVLLKQQHDVFGTLKVHCHKGGLCLVMGEPGTGKSVVKEALRQKADKRMVVISVNRTMHTYSNTLKILCSAFSIDHEGLHVNCEKRLIEQAYALNREGKSIVTVVDEAHLLDIEVLRRLRLMFEEFPKNHNLILFGQTELLSKMSLKVNEDIKSRITYSTVMLKLISDDIEAFILAQLINADWGTMYSPKVRLLL